VGVGPWHCDSNSTRDEADEGAWARAQGSGQATEKTEKAKRER
jgi:hypothetical protein